MRHSTSPGTIPHQMWARAAATPDGVACCYRNDGQQWLPIRWRDYWEDVSTIASALVALGVEPGDRIGIVAGTRWEWQLLDFAGMLAGGVIVGIDAAAKQRIRPILQEAQVTCLVVEGDHDLRELRQAAGRAMKLTVAMGQAARTPRSNPVYSLADLRELGRRSGKALPVLSARSPAALIYTSGTTGESRAVAFTHEQFMLACKAICEAFPLAESAERTLCWLPMAHLFQRMMNLVSMSTGATVYFVSRPEELSESIRQARPTVFFAVPRFYEKLYEHLHQGILRLPSWKRRLAARALGVAQSCGALRRSKVRAPIALRLELAVLDLLILRRIRRVMGPRVKFMISGSAPISCHLLEFFDSLGWKILEAYGISENTVPVAANRPDDFRYGSVGRPLPPNHVRLAHDGEILVKGPGLGCPYPGNRQENHFATRDGYFPTGDLGRFDEDGYLYLTGRKKEIIKLSTGRQVAPARIEAEYARSPLIDRIVVVGNGRKHLVGLVSLEWARIRQTLPGVHGSARAAGHFSGDDPAVQVLIRRELDAFGGNLAPYERIANFAVLPEALSVTRGELTPTAKIRRAQIEQSYAELIDRLYQPDCLVAGSPLA